MSKVTNLSVHRNTRDRRRAKRRQKDLIEDAKYAARMTPVMAGYAVVAWNVDGASVSWDVRDGEEHTMPERVRMLLAGSVHEGGFVATED